MADEAQIVNRIVVQGIDEAKAQVQSLKQLLSETKLAYEQARRSTDQQGLFQGDNKSAQDLLKNVNSIQSQIAKLNSEISQGYASMSGTQASYAKQMSSMNASIEQQFQLLRQGSIGQAEYAMSLDKYTKGMSVAKAEQEAFSKSIGTYTGQWERMRARVESHASWIIAGGLIGAAIAIPGAALDSIVRMDNAMAGMNQVMDHTNTAAVAAGKGISEQAEQQNMLNAESQKFLTIAAQYGESVDNIIKAGQLWGKHICSAA